MKALMAVLMVDDDGQQAATYGVISAWGVDATEDSGACSSHR